MISSITLNPCIDKTVYVDKLACYDTNRITKVEIDAGGKGINCSRMIKELGGTTTALAFLGGETGDYVKFVLDRRGVGSVVVETAVETRTNICIEEKSNTPPTTLNEPGGPIEHKELVELFERAKDLARESSFMVIGGSVPLGVNPDVKRVLIQIAMAGGAKAVLDADGDAFTEGIKAKPFMIKPNIDEAQRLLNKTFESKSDVARAALELSRTGIELVIISLGKQGAVACYEGSIYDAATPQVEPKSTIGSGDSLIAGVVYGLEQGLKIEECLALGCASGAATALSDGTDIGKKEDVDRLIGEARVTKIEVSQI
ncbi:MAG: 1-phosphofructokinase family hexose kinase [Armatimonadetes bacterium]|nr:1-phosphofructokinase family hexose kinase [Armatimonadota bacterium]